MKQVLLFGLLVIASTLFNGCADPKKDETSTTGNAIDRTDILTHLADKVIVPAYDAYADQLQFLIHSADTFSAAPNQNNLLALRAAWEEAYLSWQTVELFDFGKAEGLGLRNYTNLYPCSEAKINSNIQNPSANLALPSNYDAQGYAALDYLINGLAATDEEILELYTTDVNAAKRLVYLDRLLDTHLANLNQVINDWKGKGREDFIGNNGTSIGSSFSNMTNSYVKNYERYIRSAKIGIPSGAMTNGTLSPETVEAFYKKDISKKLALKAHQASIDFFEGKDFVTKTPGIGFKTYLDGLGAVDATSQQKLSKIIGDQFAATTSKFGILDDNFHAQLQTNAQPFKDVYFEMQKSVKYLKVDMTSAMSITITYTDNDGD